MKRIRHISLLHLLLCVVIFTACSSDDEEKYVTVNETNLEFDSNGGSQNIAISANTKWTIECASEWIKVSLQEGSGDKQISLSIAANSDWGKRISYIQIKSDALSQAIKVNITQLQKDSISIGKYNDTTFDWKGGTKDLSFQSNVDTQIIIPDETTWIHATKTRALSNGMITITVDENTSSQRQSTITLKGDTISKEITITQKAFVPVQSISFQEGSSLLIDKNEKTNITLHPVFKPENSSDQTLEWTSSDSDIIEVDQNGTLNIKANGTSSISAHIKKADKTVAILVTVKIKAESIRLKNEWGGDLVAYCVEGNWGYSFVPQIEIEPQNAYIEDLVIISEDENLVSVNGKTVICNNQNKAGKTRIIANLPYSNLSTSFEIKVQCSYLVAGLGLIQQFTDKCLISFTGFIYSNNRNDKFHIEGISIVNENNYVITTGKYYNSNNTNKVYWNSYEIDLTNYGMPAVINDVFFETLSQWKAIITYRYNDFEYIASESININPHNQYEEAAH